MRNPVPELRSEDCGMASRLPYRLKTKVEATSRKAQRDGVLINGRQGLHITRRAMRSYGEETLLDERKRFDSYSLAVIPETESGTWDP